MMKILVQFLFETGDTSCRFWQELAVIHGTDKSIKEIEDSLSSYFESDASEDTSYEESVADVLNASGLSWEPAEGGIPACDCMRTIWA